MGVNALMIAYEGWRATSLRWVGLWGTTNVLPPMCAHASTSFELGDGGYSAHRISHCCIFKCLHISRCGARNNRRHVARNASCRCAHGWNSVGSVPRDKSLGTVLTQALLVPLPAVVTTRIHRWSPKFRVVLLSLPPCGVCAVRSVPFGFSIKYKNKVSGRLPRGQSQNLDLSQIPQSQFQSSLSCRPLFLTNAIIRHKTQKTKCVGL